MKILRPTSNTPGHRLALRAFAVAAVAALPAALLPVGASASATFRPDDLPPEAPRSVTFRDPGAHSWTVPDGVCRVDLTVQGGAGGTVIGGGPKYHAGELGGGAYGGHGGAVDVQKYAVEPGDTLDLYVGASGVSYTAPFGILNVSNPMFGIAAGGGGGASTVNRDDPALRIIAGGGGGAAYFLNDDAAPATTRAYYKANGGAAGVNPDGTGEDALSTSPWVTPAKGGGGGVGGAGGAVSSLPGLGSGGSGANGNGGPGGAGAFGDAASPMAKVTTAGGTGPSASPVGSGGDGNGKVAVTSGGASNMTGGAGGGGGGGFGGGGGGVVGAGAGGGSVGPTGSVIHRGIPYNDGPDEAENGSIDIVWWFICDGGGGGGGAGAPTVTPPGPVPANGTTPVVFDLPPTITPGDSPIDGGATCIVDPATNACGTQVTLPTQGSWSLDLAAGTLTFTPLPTATPGAIESVVLRVTARDGKTGEGTFSVLIPDGSARPGFAG